MRQISGTRIALLVGVALSGSAVAANWVPLEYYEGKPGYYWLDKDSVNVDQDGITHFTYAHSRDAGVPPPPPSEWGGYFKSSIDCARRLALRESRWEPIEDAGIVAKGAYRVLCTQ